MAFDTVSLDRLLEAQQVTALDAVRLRDCLTHEGPVSETEARAFFAIEKSRSAKHPSWKSMFIDAVTAYAIHDAPPDGYLTADKADWLIREAAPQGRILSATMFELLTTIVAAARWSPERLVAAFLDEVYCAVACGDGPLREGAAIAPGNITDRDTELVRHVLYAAGGNDMRAITRCEAAGLLAIDAACVPNAANPAWTELFTKALGDAAMTASGYAGPVREIFLAPEHGPTDPGSAIAGLRRGLARYRPQSAEDLAIAGLERQRLAIVTGDEVQACTAEWLAAALSRDHSATPARAILMAALAEQQRLLHPALQDLMARERSIRAA